MDNPPRNGFANPAAPALLVEAALHAMLNPSFTPIPTLLQKEFSLEGRVAIVTGGRRGLGLEMAEALAEAGAAVYCLSASKAPNDDWLATQAYVTKLGLVKSARLEYVSVDVSNQSTIREVIEEIAQKEGRLDVCVANAGVLEEVPCLDMSAAQFEKIIDINANGMFYTAQAAGRQMKQFGMQGSIILVTSIAGSVALQGVQTTAYNASKGAGIQMARSLACELAPHGVRVNSLSPGYIYTDMIQPFMNDMEEKLKSQNPLGRLGKPAELRGAIVWLASDASAFCIGSNIVVDGGHRAW